MGYNMTMLIDTHCHIHDPAFNFDPESILECANIAEVKKIIVIGTSPADNLIAKQFATQHEQVFWSYGYHPEVPDNITPSLDHLSFLADEKLVAIGEVGLDYHHQPSDRSQQIRLFEQMIELALQRGLPLIFHVRDAFADFWPIVDNAHIKNAVLHSFSDSQANLEAGLDRGFYIGVNGLATFAPIPLPPLEKMLLETDAPYLTPAPFRGKINEPSYTKTIAEWVADKLKVPLDVVAQQTTQNATKLFNF